MAWDRTIASGTYSNGNFARRMSIASAERLASAAPMLWLRNAQGSRPAKRNSGYLSIGTSKTRRNT
jgi:hypothetical protein